MYAQIGTQISVWQRTLHDLIATQVDALKATGAIEPLLMLILIGFGYGAFHVLAPGHGKVIVASYFLGNKAKWKEGVWAGAIMAVGHTVTSIGIVVVLNLLLGMTNMDVLAKARYAEMVGYGLIIVIGAWMLWNAATKAEACASCGHVHGASEAHGLDDARGFFSRGVSLFASASLVPCAGSMIILLFTLANDILWAGVISVIAIAIGMWLTITLIGFASMAVRRMLALDVDTPARAKVRQALRIGAALVIIAVGSLLFLGVSGPGAAPKAGPFGNISGP
jgi:nickel/cobalt exporter